MANSDPLEKEIERKGSDYAVQRGWLEVKLIIAGERAWPDRMYIRHGRVVFVEWKRNGKEPSRQQLLRHAEIRAHGGEVVVMDSLEQAYELFV